MGRGQGSTSTNFEVAHCSQFMNTLLLSLQAEVSFAVTQSKAESSSDARCQAAFCRQPSWIGHPAMSVPASLDPWAWDPSEKKQGAPQGAAPAEAPGFQRAAQGHDKVVVHHLISSSATLTGALNAVSQSMLSDSDKRDCYHTLMESWVSHLVSMGARR